MGLNIPNHKGNENQNLRDITFVRMPIIKKKRDNKFGEDVEKGNSSALLVGR